MTARGDKTEREATSIGKQMIEDLREFRDTLNSSAAIDKRFTVRTVELKLEPKTFDPEDVKALRSGFRVSQAVFAYMIGVTPKLVQSWEQGIRTPRGPALRSLQLMHRDPDFFSRWLQESVTEKSNRKQELVSQ